MKLTHTAVREAKLLSVLRRELGMSSTLVKRLKYNRAFLVNGAAVHTDFCVRPGDVISVCIDETPPEHYPAQDAPLSVLYEDEFLIGLDKPAGMLTHPSFSHNEGTLANYLLGYYRRTGQSCAAHFINRLDRDTFGIVLLAKNTHVHARLFAMQREGLLHKQYRAAVFGCPAQTEGTVDAPIARMPGQSLLRRTAPDGKPAETQYRIVGRNAQCTLLELTPLTGRTHQLRLHCALLGCPILGDPQYGTAESTALSDLFGLKMQQLCAVSLSFSHPMTGKIVEIRSKQSVSLDFSPVADV